jgi:hypothetical protein
MKKITKTELKKALKIAQNRRELHSLPSIDDRPFLINKLYHEAISQLLHEGYVEKGYYDTFPFQFNEKKIITERIIISIMNKLLIEN